MTTTPENYVKILFRFYSNLLEKQTVETMWAEIMDADAGLYILDSIPFYASDLAFGDVISAVYSEDKDMLTYKETVSYSGNSTVQVIVFEKMGVTDEIRAFFDDLGCVSEKFKEGYFVIDVPADLTYTPVRNKLQELSEAGIIDYAEPCLSAAHGNAQ